MGRVTAELYSSQLIASCRHLSKRYYRILLYILQILLIIPQGDFGNKKRYDHCSNLTSDFNIQSATQLAVNNIFQQTLFCLSKNTSSYKPIKRPVDEPGPQHSVKNNRQRPWSEAEIQAQSPWHTYSIPLFSTFLIQAMQLQCTALRARDCGHLHIFLQLPNLLKIPATN